MPNSSQRKAFGMVAASLGIILVPLVLSIAGYVLGEDTDSPFLEAPDEKYKECVEETEYMRFYHMDVLKALRVKVVRDGVRQEVTLDSCRECHPNREKFCNRCHDAASLNLDCFGCHFWPLN